jgi:CBS domain containing-hemolysin-like protein
MLELIIVVLTVLSGSALCSSVETAFFSVSSSRDCTKEAKTDVAV